MTMVSNNFALSSLYGPCKVTLSLGPTYFMLQPAGMALWELITPVRFELDTYHAQVKQVDDHFII